MNSERNVSSAFPKSSLKFIFFIFVGCDEHLPVSRLRGAAETIVVARGDDVAAIATEVGFVFDVGIMCAALFAANDWFGVICM